MVYAKYFFVKMANFTKICGVSLLIVAFVGSINCQKNTIFDEDLVITQSQKIALDKFKARVLPILPEAYMKEDIYLIRWLRAKNFDISQAEEFLRENLKWRKLNKMEKIHEEDFSDIVSDFPVFVDSYDKSGAPIITAIAGHWDLRRAHISGEATRLHRFLDKTMDEAAMKVREAQSNPFPLFVETHFPGLTDKIVIFNAPATIQAVRPIVRGAISGRTRGNIHLFGTNKAEWQKYLLEFIDAEQLTEDFGGKRIRE
ncbi:SEC14-like protein 2 [Orchesella cincta]|uniref:SEC14-like protein 2 n=1 Tax=Orchesella cincta TaxID=48709 RepID=A0A1D2NLT0_ORCCI|nr:SEC14-like protein 2 [Orchesella cincta]